MIEMPRSTAEHPAHIAICMSGSGSNAEVLLEKSSLPGAVFKAAVIFTDAPQSSRALELGEKFGVPVESLDIRKFYADNGEDDIKLINDRRRQLRDEWSEKVWESIRKYDCDFAVFAGFVPLTNLAEKLPCLNVHPGDLTAEKDGKRIYAGLHYEPVERAILDGCKYLRSSVILVQSCTGKKDIDAGPILGVSAPVPVDLDGSDLETLKTVKAERTAPPYKDALRRCAEKNIETLKVNGDHVVLWQVVTDFAKGNYRFNDDGSFEYRNGENWQQVRTVEFAAGGVKPRLILPVVRKKKSLIRFFKYLYVKVIRGQGSPDYIARGWALGMCVGCIVPVFCQLVVAVPLSFVIRGSKVGAALGTFITTPPTAIFIYPVQIWVGNKLINGSLAADDGHKLLAIFNDEALSFAEKWSSFADVGGELIAAFFAGGVLWAAIMTPLTYFGVRFLVVRYRKMRAELFASIHQKKACK